MHEARLVTLLFSLRVAVSVFKSPYFATERSFDLLRERTP